MRSLTFKLSFVLMLILVVATSGQTFRLLSDLGRQWFLHQRNLGALALEQARASSAKIVDADLGPLSGEEGDVALRLFAPDGRLLDWMGNLESHPPIGEAELAKLREVPKGQARLVVPFYEGLALGLRLDIEGEPEPRYLVYSQTLQPAPWVQAVQRLARRNLIYSTVVASIAGLMLVRWLRRRLRNMGQAFQQVEAGNLATRVPVPKERELAELASSFNRMASALEAAHASQAQAEAERRTFMAMASHELRTPLTALQGYLETLTMEDVPLDAATEKSFLNKAFLESQELGHRIADLTELTRIERPEFKLEISAIHLGSVFEELERRYQPLASSSGVGLVGLDACSLPVVQADRRRIAQALGNLLHNAIKASPKGGQIQIHAKIEAEQIVVVEISDQGPGLAAGYQDPSGLGLGLRIASLLLEKHGGLLHLEPNTPNGLKACAKWFNPR